MLDEEAPKNHGEIKPQNTARGGFHDIWTGLGFTILPFTLFVTAFINVNPQIWRSLPTETVIVRSAPDISIAWNDEEQKNPPLEYKSDKITFVMVTTSAPKLDSFWELFATPTSQVEWTWEYEIKNLSPEDQKISVDFFLADTNQSRLTEASKAIAFAKPQEIVTLRGRGSFDYGLLKSVVGADWEISHSPN
jgi:hypothetical protein